MSSQTSKPAIEPLASKTRWMVLGLVAFASASAYLTRYCVSAANTTIQSELNLGDKQMGWILGAFSLGYLFFQVPGGLLGNRFGTRFAFSFINALWSLCNVWSGAAVAFISLLASRFALGAFQAGLTPISGKILRDWVPGKHHGVSSAAITACMSIGGGFTLWMTGELLQGGHEWRVIFYVYSVVGIVWAILFYAFFRTLPADHWLVNKAELAQIGQDTKAKESDEDQDEFHGGKDVIVGMFSSLSMWALCVISFFRAAGYAFFVTWFFAFLEYVYGIDKDAAGLLTSLPLFAVVVGSLIGGVLVDGLLRVSGSRRVSRCGTGFVALGICAALTLASTFTSSATQLSIVMALGAFFSGLANPASWAVTIDLGGKRTAVVMGTMNMAGCAAGVILPILLGTWFDEIKQSGGNWNQVIYLHAVFYTIASAGWLLITPSRTLFDRR